MILMKEQLRGNKHYLHCLKCKQFADLSSLDADAIDEFKQAHNACTMPLTRAEIILPTESGSPDAEEEIAESTNPAVLLDWAQQALGGPLHPTRVEHDAMHFSFERLHELATKLMLALEESQLAHMLRDVDDEVGDKSEEIANLKAELAEIKHDRQSDVSYDAYNRLCKDYDGIRLDLEQENQLKVEALNKLDALQGRFDNAVVCYRELRAQVKAPAKAPVKRYTQDEYVAKNHPKRVYKSNPYKNPRPDTLNWRALDSASQEDAVGAIEDMYEAAQDY